MSIVAPVRLIQPDVQVLIMPFGRSAQMVDMTYPRVVSGTQAQRDVNAVSASVGLTVSNLEITNSALPLSGVKSTPMTSTVFRTSGALPASGNTLALEPWIVGLRGYSNLAITYMMQPGFTFNGLRQFRDGDVDILLDHRGGMYTYHVRVLNSSFGRLNLPLMQPDARSVQVAQDEQRRVVRFRILGLVVVSALAAAVGYAVYALLSR